MFVTRPPPTQHSTLSLHDALPISRRDKVDIIYGTVRLIEQDRESFLPWARRPYACVIFNVHVEHTTRDRKSTRLNSSHLVISYAVFCLKKKIKDEEVLGSVAPLDW